jgi:2-keto-3-deoxy-L-fuconate dehydrogenase
MGRLAGKSCVVTGAASGIGRASAVLFAKEGASVNAIDVDEERLASLKTEPGTIETHTLDVLDRDKVVAFSARIGPIDVLLNCAGKVSTGTVLDCSFDEWQSSLALNVSSIFYLTQAFVPGMIAKGGGSIINMASVISSLGAAPDRFAYGATKAAVIGMTKSVARDFAGKGVRCNAICPSAVDTPSMRARIDMMEDPEAAYELFSKRQPVGRMARPDEIAEMALYLASDASGFVTGSAMVIDGGTWA